MGRFFAPVSGHAKKQLEMVEAFRRLCDGGAEGWELHLVGGCGPEDRAYLDEVRAAAEGLPVVLHVDASGAEVDRLYRRASIYWHATGLGEDLDADPVRAEHFGITTVEAMSAGAVPVVIAAGGQPEIVRDGVDGLLFTDLDGLVAATRELIADPARREGLAASARARAEGYGLEAFGVRLERAGGRRRRPLTVGPVDRVGGVTRGGRTCDEDRPPGERGPSDDEGDDEHRRAERRSPPVPPDEVEEARTGAGDEASEGRGQPDELPDDPEHPDDGGRRDDQAAVATTTPDRPPTRPGSGSRRRRAASSAPATRDRRGGS